MYNILVVAGDPGGANALVPVIDILKSDSGINLILYGYNESYGIWSEKYGAVNEVPSSADENIIAEILIHEKIVLLLTGTSCNEHMFEQKFILAAKKTGIKTVSLLDFWSSYKNRFYNSTGDPEVLPDKIAVMDELCLKQMISEGFDKKILAITGQPAFDELEYLYQNFDMGKKRMLMDYYGFKNETIIVIFVSQPFSELYSDDKILFPDYGFTELDIIEPVIQSLDQISKENNLDIQLIICPHPREKLDKFESFLSPKVKLFRRDIKMDDSAFFSSKELILCSDLIIGMNSVLLVESCYLKKVAISFQPGLLRSDPLPTNLLGYTVPVYEIKDLTKEISEYVLNQNKKDEHINKLNKLSLSKSSAENVAELIISQIN